MRFDLSHASAEIRGSIVNLSDVPDSVAVAAASVSDLVRITIEDLTPSCGPVTVPVRVRPSASVLPLSHTDSVAALESLAAFGLATKSEYRMLRKICRILSA